jgi:hypothetical protein
MVISYGEYLRSHKQYNVHVYSAPSRPGGLDLSQHFQKVCLNSRDILIEIS